MLQFFRYFLFPISFLYKVITTLRNLLFDFGILNTYNPHVPSIGVGNLTVGGTGKTPVVDYLLKTLENENKLCVISRGYGRKTSGLREISKHESPDTVGDEPFMLFLKHPKVNFIVSEKRKTACEYLKNKNSEEKLIVFDDVFQHRWVKPSVMLMLSDYNRPFYRDYQLPTGNLRESRSGAKRADIILVTKCPVDLSLAEKEAIKFQISKYSKGEVFFSSILISVESPAKAIDLNQNEKVVLVSALANNEQFYRSLHEKYQIQTHFKFPDHFQYTQSEISKILKPKLPIITTEKDFVKINRLISGEYKIEMFVSKIMLKIENEKGFWDSLQSKLK